MTRKLPDVLDESDDRKRIWAAAEEALGFRVFYVDRQFIWDAIAHELADQIRQTPCAPGVDICACCSLAADRIDPEAQR